MVIPNPPAELFYKFNDIKYHDEPHKYYIGDTQLTSVTTVIHKYEEGFDEEKWSRIKGEEFGVPQDDVKYAWRFINERATTKGSAIHDYTENLFLNKVFPYPKELIQAKFGYDPVWDEFVETKKLVDRFYEKIKNVLIPIKTELVVYDKEFAVAGMVDMLFYNKKSKMFEIWDWKTNSADKAFNEDPEKVQYLQHPLYLLQNTAMDIYSLQLSTYKYIIEKNTNIKLGNSYIVWFSHKNEDYEVKKCHDYTLIADDMLRDHRMKYLNQ
jgi:hypothetical protein